MSSLPITAPAAESDRVSRLLDLLATVPDPRDPRGVRYPLAGILAVAVTGVLAGARSFAAIGDWAADLSGEYLARIGPTAAPDESTLRKLFTRLDADALDRLVGAWMWTRTRHVEGRRVIAIDGKSVRGAKRPDGRVPHLVAAFDHGTGTVLGQLAVAAKSNEIPCVRDLLACFDLTGAAGDHCSRPAGSGRTYSLDREERQGVPSSTRPAKPLEEQVHLPRPAIVLAYARLALAPSRA